MKYYVLELFSGNGTVSYIASQILECGYESIDIDEDMHPTICKDILKWSEKDTADLKAKYPNCRPVIFASPPCEEYSPMKTTGVRDLLRADACVRKVHEISAALDALMLFVENPERGMLKNRVEVREYLPAFKYHVCYCQYGTLYRKSTLIWVSDELKGFEPKVCDLLTCPACFVDSQPIRRHILTYEDLDLERRISIPDHLIAALFKAAKPIIIEKASKIERMQREKDEFKIDYIVTGDVMVDYEDEVDFWLEVKWKGHDDTSFIPIGNLEDPLETYPFKSPGIQTKVLKAYKAFKKTDAQAEQPVPKLKKQRQKK